MAYDYIKAKLPSQTIKHLEKHPKLSFERRVVENTGELGVERIAKYKNLLFVIRYNSIWLKGSLHWFSEGKSNYNDFTYEMLMSVLDEIERVFEVDLSESKLENIEVGVNIQTEYDTALILDNLLIHGVEKFRDESVNFRYYYQYR
jgi:hypothetical protein